MRRHRRLLLYLTVVSAMLSLSLALLSLIQSVAQAQTPTPTETPTPVPGCEVTLLKSAQPDTIRLGETAKVTLVMTHACEAVAPPVDLMFLVDISNSMTKGEGGRIDEPCNPGGITDPFPTEVPTKDPTPGETGVPPAPETPGSIIPTGVISSATRPPSLPLDPTQPGHTIPTQPTKGTPPPGPGTPVEPPTQGPPPRTPPSTPTSGSITNPTPGGSITDPTPAIGPTRPIVDPRPKEDPGTEDLVGEIQSFLRNFVREPSIKQATDEGRLRLGIIAFESRPHTVSGLTSKLSRVTSGIARLDSLPHGTTNISLGFYRANQIMDRGYEASRGSVRIIVVMTDGKFDQRTIRGLRTREGITHLGIAMGKSPDINQLGNIVTERRFLLTQRDYQDFFRLYTDELQALRPVGLAKAVVRDELAENMRLDPSSVVSGTINGQVIEWTYEPPTTPLTLTYVVEPLEPGRWAVSTLAKADWTDTVQRVGTGNFPVVHINVIPPTETPTPVFTDTPTLTPTDTPTPTATATPRPKPLFFPVALRQPVPPKPCIPSEQTVDVAIVIDTSDSMLELTTAGRTKLAAAVEAARALAGLLKLDAGGDQVTVIAFNNRAYVLTPLTSDSAAVEMAVGSLPTTQDRGTRINLALLEGLAQMTTPARRPGNNAAMVLLTDGQHEGQPDDVRQAARAVKDAGIAILTVGLGTNVDGALLAEVASDPAYYYYAPDAEGLVELYRRIAVIVPCP